MRVTTFFVLFLLASATVANERFVTTKGEATIEAPPDFVKISMALLGVGPDLAQIKADVDARTERVLAAAAQLGIAGADIESEGLRVSREYESDRNDNETLRGYEVSRNIEVKLRAIAKYEEFAQALIDAKVDTVEEVEVDVDDRQALDQRALVAATRNARSEALAIATELSIQIGTPFEVSEDRLHRTTRLRELASVGYDEIVVTGARARSTPAVQLIFKPHAIEIEATVWARFEIVTKESP